MQTKIRKLIQQIPADNLRPFLENYDLNLPKDFKWKNDHKQYHVELHNCIWNIHEDHKPSLFEAIERIHEMTEEWGQAALCAEIGKDNQFFSLQSDHARCLWVFKNHPEKFLRAEQCADLEFKRKSREWSSFEAPEGGKFDDCEKNREEFRQLALKNFDISRQINIEIFNRSKKDHEENDIEVIQLIACYDGLQKAVQAFEKEKLVTKFITFASEFSVSYEPKSRIIEVTADHKETRIKLAKSFVEAFLKVKGRVGEVRLKKYNLSKLRASYNFMKEVDAKDQIEDVRVTMLKLKPFNSHNSNTIESPFSYHGSVYELAQDWYGERNPLLGSFTINKVRLSIKFKPSTKKSRGELLNIMN